MDFASTNRKSELGHDVNFKNPKSELGVDFDLAD